MSTFQTPAPSFDGPRTGPRWKRIIGGIAILLLLAAPCLIGVIVTAIASNVKERTSAIAEGRAPGTLTFTTEQRKYIVALSAKPDGIFDGLTALERRAKMNVRESDANEARCEIRQPDGSTKQLRGDRQTSSTVVGNRYATVGSFDGQAGSTTVTCRFDPEKDMIGTVTETPLMVHPTTSLHGWMWGFIAGLLLFTGLGVLQILRGTVWRGQR